LISFGIEKDTNVVTLALVSCLIVTASTMADESQLELKHKNVSEVERRIREQLPIGTTRERVDAYLDANKIRHKMGWQPIPEGGGMTLLDEHTEGALIFGVRTHKTFPLGMVIRTDLEIQFKFDDKNLKLIDCKFREVHSGP
jgi:hypothetical protein